MPIAHALAVGRRVWSQQGRQDEQPPIVAVFRVLLPPRPGHRFSRSLGPLARDLALVAYASRAEPGSLGAEVVNIPRGWTCKPCCAGGQVGGRIAPMLSPLRFVVTAQKPSDVTSVPGVSRFGQSPKRAAMITDDRRDREELEPLFLPSQNNTRRLDLFVLTLPKE